MTRIPDHIPSQLDRWAEDQALRKLSLPRPGSVDFTSNDYLGLARWEVSAKGKGSTGSRLLSGQHALHAELEAWCADFFRGEAALLFNSGYLANLGILGALPRRGDTILYDDRVHASIKEGMRLSPARRFRFRHEDMADLKRLLETAAGTVYIVAEGLYSMDGDLASVREMTDLADQYGAFLILDEAHSTGIVGEQGRGWAVEKGVEEKVFLRVYTFGKAVGWHGAVVVGPEPVIQFLVNRARSLIYTTALPPSDAWILRQKLERMADMDAERGQLKALRAAFMAEMEMEPTQIEGAILPWRIPGNAAVRAAAAQLQAEGLDVRPIVSPTVPSGEEQLRIVFHAYNTLAEVRQLAHALRRWGDDLAHF